MRVSSVIQVGPRCSHLDLHKEEAKEDQTQKAGGNRKVEAETGEAQP